MKKTVLLLSFILLFFNLIKSQENIELKEVFDDAEYFFSIDEYREAYMDYLILYKRGFDENANINYKLGVSCLHLSPFKKLAIKYLEEAIKNVGFIREETSLKQTKAPVDAFLYLGNAYRINNECDKAINSYNEYKKIVGNKDKLSTDFADQEINTCEIAKEMMKKPLNLKITNISLPGNSGLIQYNPVVSEDENSMVYMESQKFYEAIFYVKKEKGKWTDPVNITPDIESDGNLILSSISSDGNQIFLQKDDRFNSDVYQSSYIDSNWQKVREIKSPVNSKYWESNASISPDGKVIYFASNRAGGLGGMDIYKSELNQTTGQWDSPVNLGTKINTAFNEDCPVILADGRTLAFSSQGHYNMGGYDLFYSKMDSDGNWGEAINAGYPINSTDDDLNYFPVKDGKIIYASRPLPNVPGKMGIYRIELSTEVVANVIDENKKNEAVDTVLVSENSKPDRIIFKPVFFNYNEYELNQLSKTNLNGLARAIKEIPDLVIEIEGNTDNKGNLEYNQILSEKRAGEVRKYLIESGIQSDRLIIKGLGKQYPIAINNNDDGSDNPLGRRLNRRVDFTIIKGNSSRIVIERVEIPEKLKIKK